MTPPADIPSSPWARLIIGPHWPSETTVTAATASAQSRGAVEVRFTEYQRTLDTTRTVVLDSAAGETADAVRREFQQASDHAREVAQLNGVKRDAYTKSATALSDLRSDLRQIAADADSEIKQIQESKKPAPQKITEITQAVEKHARYAAHKATQHGNTLTDAVQQVLTAQGDGRSVTEFAAAHGVILGKPPLPTEESIRTYVEETLKKPSETERSPIANDAIEMGATSHSPPSQQVTTGNIARPAKEAMESTRDVPPFSHIRQTTSEIQAINPPVGPVINPIRETPIPESIRPIIDTPAFPSGPKLPAVDSIFPTAPTAPLFGPQEFTDSLANGIGSGSPLSDGLESLTHNVVESSLRGPAPPAVDITPPSFSPLDSSPPTSPTASHPAPETSYAPTPIAHAPQETSGEHVPQFFAAAPPPTPQAPVPPPAAPAGPLPAYGSDIRPPAPATAPPLTAPTLPPSATPSSAPVSASALNQQPVVRQAPPVPMTTPGAGLTETALATSTVGAAAGANADDALRAQLQRWVESVARQEPRLGWAVGRHADESTVLVTDLASGWIPPHVEIPTGITLLPPAPRSGGWEDLLGDSTVAVSWTPGQYLPSAEETHTAATSIRARDLPAIEDLNWELTRATNWRDDLPRLAHTLARAGTAGTGVLESEIDLLREHLVSVGEQVLTRYPGHTGCEVGNWQLLAAIEALISGRRTTLNYHFAWFLALQPSPVGR